MRRRIKFRTVPDEDNRSYHWPDDIEVMAVPVREWLDANVNWRGYSESPAELKGTETPWSMWNCLHHCFEIIVADEVEARLVRLRYPHW